MKALQITSDYFCAGVDINSEGLAYRCAPILRYMIGWSIQRIKSYAKEKRWLVQEIK